MKKQFASAVAALMAATMLLASCGTPSGTATSAPSATPAGTTAGTATAAPEAPAPAAEKYNIRLFTSRNQPDPQSEVMKLINEKLGVNLEVISVPDEDYETKMNLFLASNDIPDIFTTRSKPDLMKAAAAALTPEEFQQYMPLTYAAAEEQFPLIGMTFEKMYKSFTTPEGKLAGIYIGQVNQTIPYVTEIRQDLLDELVGGKMPQTIDDWDVLLAAYKAAYPKQYPLSAKNREFQQNFYPFFSGYGTSVNRWCLVDDVPVFGPFMPEFREALLKLKSWYDLGYINPEFVTMDDAAYSTEWTNGNMLLKNFYHLSNPIDAPYPTGSENDVLLQNVPTAKLAWMPFPVANPDVKPSVSNGSGMGTEATSFGIHLEKDKDKLYAAMGVMDKLVCDEEIYMWRRFGIEGVTYEYVDGIPTYTADYAQQDAQVKAGINWLYQGSSGVAWSLQEPTMPAVFRENVTTLLHDPDAMYGRNNINLESSYWSGDLMDSNDETMEWVLYDDLWDNHKRLHVQVIIGEATIEDYDKMVNDWQAKYGEGFTADGIAAYKGNQ